MSQGSQREAQSGRLVTPDRAVLVGLFLAAAVYCRDLQYGFILDDVPLILMNPVIASWRNWKTLFVTHIFYAPGPSAPMSFVAKHYRPVYMLWLMLNETIFGSIVPWWHLTSLLLHVAVVFLVYQLGVKLLRDRWTAALAALIFAFHPIHVESISYVSASTDLLVTFFLLISFLAYARFREQNASVAWLIAAIFAAALAMFSKETAVMYPWCLVAYEVVAPPHAGASDPGKTVRRRLNWRQFVWTLPFFAVVGAYLAIRTALFGKNLGPGPGGSRIAALADAPLVLILYLRNLLWSFRLSFFYPTEWTSQWTVWKGLEIYAVLLVAGFLWRRYREKPAVRLQLLWATLFFVPPVLTVSTLLREDWVHDRHMYLISVPLCLLAAVVLTDARLPQKAAVALSTAVLAVLIFQTAVQVPKFTDEITLYKNTLAIAPDNFVAHRFYAFALWSYGRYDEAFQEFRVMAQLRPENPEVHGNYAQALAERGRDDEALAEYQAALDRDRTPTVYHAYLLYRLSILENKHGQPESAAAHMREALKIAPDTRDYHAVLAEALKQQGQIAAANEQLQVEANIRRQLQQPSPATAK